MTDTPSSFRQEVPPLLAFGVSVGLVAALLKATLATSRNEVIPLTLGVFVATVAALGRLRRHAHWRGALSLSVLLVSWALLPHEPIGSSLSWTTDTPCHLYDNSLRRLTGVLFFPITTQYALVWGLVAGIMAALAFRGAAWGRVTGPLRWLSTSMLALTLIWALHRSWGRPGPVEYLTRGPVVATLFPASEGFMARPESCAWCGEYPEVPAGVMRFQRICDRPGPEANCQVRVKGDPNPLACVRSGSRVVVREVHALGAWMIHEGDNLYAFRPRPGPEVPRLDVRTNDLLMVTKPPAGWVLTPLAGLAIAAFATQRRRRAAKLAPEPLAGASWDLVGIAAVVLSFLAIAPWLLEISKDALLRGDTVLLNTDTAEPPEEDEEIGLADTTAKENACWAVVASAKSVLGKINAARAAAKRTKKVEDDAKKAAAM